MHIHQEGYFAAMNRFLECIHTYLAERALINERWRRYTGASLHAMTRLQLVCDEFDIPHPAGIELGDCMMMPMRQIAARCVAHAATEQRMYRSHPGIRRLRAWVHEFSARQGSDSSAGIARLLLRWLNHTIPDADDSDGTLTVADLKEALVMLAATD